MENCIHTRVIYYGEGASNKTIYIPVFLFKRGKEIEKKKTF